MSPLVTEPNKRPSTPAFCATVNTKPASLAPRAVETVKISACCFSNSARLAANSALLASVARFALPCGIKKLRPKPFLTLTISPSNPRFATFSNKIICMLSLLNLGVYLCMALMLRSVRV